MLSFEQSLRARTRQCIVRYLSSRFYEGTPREILGNLLDDPDLDKMTKQVANSLLGAMIRTGIADIKGGQ